MNSAPQHFPNKQEKPQPLSLQEAKNYVFESGSMRTHEEMERLKREGTNNAGCIDGRKSSSDPESNKEIAIPGGGLALYTVAIGVLSAAEKIGYKFKNGVDRERVWSILHEKLGKPTYHTDDHSLHDNLCCAGCGHCKRILTRPLEYGLTSEDVDFIMSKLPSVQEECHKDIYIGEHREQAVFLVRSKEIKIPSTFNEMQVFVYDKRWHLYFAKLIGDILSEHVREDPEFIQSMIYTLIDTRIKITVSELAKDLPVYNVFQTIENRDGIEVKKIQVEAH